MEYNQEPLLKALDHKVDLPLADSDRLGSNTRRHVLCVLLWASELQGRIEGGLRVGWSLQRVGWLLDAALEGGLAPAKGGLRVGWPCQRVGWLLQRVGWCLMSI